jgi:hypothetical protein
VSWGWVAAFVAFVAYAILAAPPDDPALTAALVKGTFTGRFGAVDPAIAAVFAALGVVPALASTLLLRDGARRRIPAWPFALGMFAVGAFALLPWLALRGSFGARPEQRDVGALRRLVARPAVGWALLLALTALLAWGLLAGSATAYARAFATTSMVNVMTVDLPRRPLAARGARALRAVHRAVPDRPRGAGDARSLRGHLRRVRQPRPALALTL